MTYEAFFFLSGSGPKSLAMTLKNYKYFNVSIFPQIGSPHMLFELKEMSKQLHRGNAAYL